MAPVRTSIEKAALSAFSEQITKHTHKINYQTHSLNKLPNTRQSAGLLERRQS